MNNAQLLDGGENPVIVNSSYNNGVGGYTSQKNTEDGNIITFSDTTTAESIFYQEEPFVGYPHVQGMYPAGIYKEYWTKERMLFFLTAFKKAAMLMDFNYVYKFTREIASNISVFLPVNSTGNIDWEYMDSFMMHIMCESETSLRRLRLVKDSKTTIDTSFWKRFHLYDELFFDIDMGTKLDKGKMTSVSPQINFVGRSNFNNGITMRVDQIPNIKPYEAGNLTLSLGGEYLGSCFIQSEPFYVSQNVVVLKPKWNMSHNIKLFLSLIIFRESRMYYKAFSDELNRHIKTDFSIMLPVTDEQLPDWNYMENFMSEIMILSKANFNKLKMLL